MLKIPSSLSFFSFFPKNTGLRADPSEQMKGDCSQQEIQQEELPWNELVREEAKLIVPLAVL